jgi:hypothetical protein
MGKDVIKFTDLTKVQKKKPVTYQFKIKDAESRQIRLHLDVRYDWDRLFGYTNGMKIYVNGQEVTGSRILNKTLKFKTRNGGGNCWAKPDSSNFNIMYSPDFSDKIQTDESFQYGLYEKDQQPYAFAFDLSGLTRHTGINELKIEATYSAPLIVRNARLEIDEKTMPRINDPALQVKPAPTGPLNNYQLKTLPKAEPSVRVSDDGAMEINVAGENFIVSSRFSLPNGKWLELKPTEKWRKITKGKAFKFERKTPEYTISREIRIKNDHVKVFDTFSNLCNKVTGIMLENTMTLPETPSEILRGGLNSNLNETRNIGHPSITAQLKGIYAGLLCEDDILQNQAYYKKGSQELTFGDRNLGLPAKQSHTLEWSVYVLPKCKYYDFVNVVRKNWNSNFTWEGPLAFPYMGGRQLQKWNKKEIKPAVVKKFLKERPINLLMTHVASNIKTSPAKSTRDVPWLGHGTAILEFSWWTNMTKKMIEAFHKTAPYVKVFVYMHKNICSESKNWEKYRDSVAMDDYSQALIKRDANKGFGRFIPTVKNSYGKALKKVYEYIVDDLNGNIYMDEICLGVTDWAPNKEWDNCTVEIDSKSHKILRKTSIPNLLSKTWLEGMLKYLRAHNKQLLANGPVATRTLQKYHFMSFIEYGLGASGLISAHFSTPIAWNGYKVGIVGYNHFRESLDYGALAITWAGPWNDHTFPFTPQEIHSGYVIGKERIITKLSGRFGWNDQSEAEFFMYDGQGNIVKSPTIKTIKENGKNVYEVRMPSNYATVIVRKK